MHHALLMHTLFVYIFHVGINQHCVAEHVDDERGICVLMAP